MPTTVQAALLGVLQGLTEFLPISSTAHLIVGERILGYQDPGGVFTVMIQLGSILAVMWLYRAKLLEVMLGLGTKPEARRFVLRIFAAFAPALVAGALLSTYVKSVLYYSPGVIAAAFIVGGIIMLIVERVGPTPTVHDVDGVPLRGAIGVGLCQTLALIPGISRAGATIVGGMAVGLDRATAAEFSFFLAMPTIAAAFAHDLFEVRDYLSRDRALEIAIGFVMSFLAALVVVKPFVNVARRTGFAPFAWYRIVAGVGLLVAIAAGWR